MGGSEHLHGESQHLHLEPEDPNDPNRSISHSFGYRCTLCNQPIPWLMKAKDMGFAPGEEPVVGKMYAYSKCYCGFGRFVICERSYLDMRELEAHLSEHMAH